MTHIHTLLSPLHPFPSIHLSLCTASRPYHEPGLVIKSQAAGGGEAGCGGGQTSDWSSRLQLESSSVCPSVSVGVLTAAADLSFPRGLCERTEMWCCYSDASYSGDVVSPSPLLHLHLLLFNPSRETPGARRGVTAVSGMLGGRRSHFPGLHLHLRPSDAGPKIGSSKYTQSIFHKSYSQYVWQKWAVQLSLYIYSH